MKTKSHSITADLSPIVPAAREAYRQAFETVLASSSPACLVIREENQPPERKVLDPPTLIGRSRGSDIRFQDTGVSRKHAMLTRHGEQPDEVVVSDLHSRNGTWVNGNRIEAPTILRSGDLVQFGRFAAAWFFPEGQQPQTDDPETPETSS